MLLLVGGHGLPPTWNRRSLASQGPILSTNGRLAGLLDIAWALTTAN
jgi:hypothetical protein